MWINSVKFKSIHNYFLKKMDFWMSSTKLQQFCLDLNMPSHKNIMTTGVYQTFWWVNHDPSHRIDTPAGHPSSWTFSFQSRKLKGHTSAILPVHENGWNDYWVNCMGFKVRSHEVTSPEKYMPIKLLNFMNGEKWCINIFQNTLNTAWGICFEIIDRNIGRGSKKQTIAILFTVTM